MRAGMGFNPVEAPMMPGQRHPKDALFVLLLGLQWCVMVAMAQVHGDFPINDDWAYVRAVQRALAEGQLHIPDWAGMNFVVHLLWGMLFGWIYEPSFMVLRVAGLSAGWLGCWASFRLFRAMGADAGFAFVCSAALAANPLYFGLSSTYMTDVPFLACTMGALWAYVHALRNGARWALFLGTLMAILAILIRQVGLAIPLAFAIAVLVAQGRSAWRSALLPLCVSVLVHRGWVAWMQYHQRLPANYDAQVQQLRENLQQPWSLFLDALGRSATYALYVGLCALIPLLVLWLTRTRTAQLWRGLLVLVLGGALFLGMQKMGWRMPLIPSQVALDGQGPALELPPLTNLLWRGWSLLTWLSCVGMLATLQMSWGLWAQLRLTTTPWSQRACAAMLVTFTGIYMLPLLGISTHFDRYALPCGVAALGLLCIRSEGLRWRPGTAALAACCVVASSLFAGAMAHDYFALQRVRWQLLDWLVEEQGISPRRIQGGFEFNGWALFDARQLKPGAKGWWVHDDEFLVGIAPRRDYILLESRAVPVWLPFSPNQLRVLRRLPATQDGDATVSERP